MKPALFTPIDAISGAGGGGGGGGAVVFTDHLAVSRASTGYAQTVAGTLTSFAANTLRVTDKGLLVEEARTNIQFQSQTFDDAEYGKQNLTVTANAVAAPDGTTTADTLTDNSTSGYHRFYATGRAGTAAA